MCTYRHPFEAANQGSLILKIVRGKYNPIATGYSK
jgi:NIMA (never in mitosis gene a)-related kinase